MKLGVTGHRPNNLWGYDYNNIYWIGLKDLFRQYCLINKVNWVYSGMALGVDTVCALAALELRDEGIDISLHCAIPCKNHSSKWPAHSVRLYDSILKRAQEITLVSDEDYSPRVMQTRNMFIVDNTDSMWAIYNNVPGGTANCVNYAIKKGKPVKIVSSKQIENYVDIVQVQVK